MRGHPSIEHAYGFNNFNSVYPNTSAVDCCYISAANAPAVDFATVAASFIKKII